MTYFTPEAELETYAGTWCLTFQKTAYSQQELLQRPSRICLREVVSIRYEELQLKQEMLKRKQTDVFGSWKNHEQNSSSLRSRNYDQLVSSVGRLFASPSVVQATQADEDALWRVGETVSEAVESMYKETRRLVTFKFVRLHGFQH